MLFFINIAMRSPQKPTIFIFIFRTKKFSLFTYSIQMFLGDLSGKSRVDYWYHRAGWGLPS